MRAAHFDGAERPLAARHSSDDTGYRWSVDIDPDHREARPANRRPGVNVAVVLLEAEMGNTLSHGPSKSSLIGVSSSGSLVD